MQLEKISLHGKDEIALIAQVAKDFPEIEAIYLFGSCARQEDTEKSDIDTLIIWNNFNNEDSGIKSFDFVKSVFNKKMFRWDRIFLSSKEEFEANNYGVYNTIKELNNVIYTKE